MRPQYQRRRGCWRFGIGSSSAGGHPCGTTWCWRARRRTSTRVSSAGRGSPRASPASRATAMATASAHAAADGPPGSRAAASLRGRVSIRRHWLSDTCTHTNTHKRRRRSPDRGTGCDAPYAPLLRRRSSGSGAMGSACGRSCSDGTLGPRSRASRRKGRREAGVTGKGPCISLQRDPRCSHDNMRMKRPVPRLRNRFNHTLHFS